MMKRFKYIAWILFSLPSFALASPYYGATFSFAAVTKEPPSLHGYQLMMTVDPDCYKWRRFNVYFDGGFSHFWINNTPYYTTLNIYSAAPVVRYTFRKLGFFSPYIELSIGLAYLNHTRLDDRNLGIHFSFQDRMGIGIVIGESKRVILGVHAVHYSNAHLSNRNSGITIPVDVDIGFQIR